MFLRIRLRKGDEYFTRQLSVCGLIFYGNDVGLTDGFDLQVLLQVEDRSFHRSLWRALGREGSVVTQAGRAHHLPQEIGTLEKLYFRVQVFFADLITAPNDG